MDCAATDPKRKGVGLMLGGEAELPLGGTQLAAFIFQAFI